MRVPTGCLTLGMVLLAFAARADCRDWFYGASPPRGTTIPTNARIVLDGHRSARAVVEDLAGHHPRLVAAEELIPLQVLSINRGEKSLSQAVLQPTRLLTPGVEYTLVFDHRASELPEIDEPAKVPRWTAGDGPDLEAPVWAKAPLPLPGKLVELGCGPLEQARLKLAVSDASAVLILARVTRPSGAAREFLLRPTGVELQVGHEMCSGAFWHGEGPWTLELTAVDAAGNATPAPGGVLRFKGLNPAPGP